MVITDIEKRMKEEMHKMIIDIAQVVDIPREEEGFEFVIDFIKTCVKERCAYIAQEERSHE